MKNVVTGILAAACMMMIIPTASASSSTAAVSQAPPAARKARQNVRIRRGVKNGSINRVERRVLRAEQRKINRTARRYKANDGKIGPVERARLNRMQNRASRHIYRAKHN